MKEYIFAFVAGGAITAVITYFEINGRPLFSRLAALFPVFTWLSYLFIGKLAGGEAVSRHARFVLLGTLVAWVPYMLMIYYYAPRIGAAKAVAVGLAVFLVLALAFVKFYHL